MSDEQKKYVQDFTSGDDEKTGLEKRVMNCEGLSTDDKLKIIRAIEKSGDSIFGVPPVYNEPFKPITQQPWWGGLQVTTNGNHIDPNQPVLYRTSANSAVKYDAEDLFSSSVNNIYMQQEKCCDENGDTD